MSIQKGNKVKVHYTGKLENNNIFDTSLQRDPIEFVVGSGQVIPGFENGVIGMSVGESKVITIPFDMAYGPTNEGLILNIPKSNAPKDVSVGSQLQSMLPSGEPISFIVREVKEDVIVVDANHPLANQNLIFEVEIVEFS